MASPRPIIPIFMFAALTGFVPAAGAQTVSVENSIRDLVATILPLTSTIQDLRNDTKDISDEVRDKIARSGDIEVREAGDVLVLSVPSDVLFAFDSSELSAKAQGTLGDVSEILAAAPNGQVTVVGHTDSKGSDDYNLKLSERRATSVAGFLKDHGVPAERLQVEGRGEAEPVADNTVDGKDNPEGRAKNRRVEIVVPKGMLKG